MKIFFTSILALLIFQNNFGQRIHFKSLEAVNLEEDKGPFATMDDEIILISAVMNIQKDSVVYWQYSEILSFNDTFHIAQLENFKTLSIDSNNLILISLIEVDDSLQAQDINEIFKTEFLKYYAYPYNLLKEKIRLIIADSDLLAFLYFKQNKLNKIDENISLKGMHMFNRFEYKLVVEIK